jgi:hypothetical protein
MTEPNFVHSRLRAYVVDLVDFAFECALRFSCLACYRAWRLWHR